MASFAGYGKLSNRALEDMEQGEDESGRTLALKENPQDFALWKAQKEGEDTAWDAPWGARPARLAHRVLGDGGADPRPGLRRARRRLAT